MQTTTKLRYQDLNARAKEAVRKLATQSVRLYIREQREHTEVKEAFDINPFTIFGVKTPDQSTTALIAAKILERIGWRVRFGNAFSIVEVEPLSQEETTERYGACEATDFSVIYELIAAGKEDELPPSSRTLEIPCGWDIRPQVEKQVAKEGAKAVKEMTEKFIAYYATGKKDEVGHVTGFLRDLKLSKLASRYIMRHAIRGRVGVAMNEAGYNLTAESLGVAFVISKRAPSADKAAEKAADTASADAADKTAA